MEEGDKNFYLWKYALLISESISCDIRLGQLTKADLVNYLESIEEAFGKTSDPLNDLQGLVLIELCRSIRRALL